MSQVVPGYNKVGSRFSGAVFMLFSFVTLWAVMHLNKPIAEPEKVSSGPAIEFNVSRPKPKKKKEPRQVKKTRPKKSQAKPLTPPPDLGVSFSGVDFGLPEFSFGGVAAITDDMIGDMDNLIMTEDSVDSIPVMKFIQPPQYPPRARANNITGSVTLRFTVSKEGSATDIEVQESNPPGVFDESAIAAMRTARFTPAKYKNKPVEMTATYTFPYTF